MNIPFEEFAKLDLRIGVVKEAEIHPSADRLYVLKVDLGDKELQLVAGIRKTYFPEELLGRRIVVLANLEPKLLRGIESQGMLLAASTESGPVLLSPDKETPAGSRVK